LKGYVGSKAVSEGKVTFPTGVGVESHSHEFFVTVALVTFPTGVGVER